MGTKAGMEETRTLDPETGPGWRELLEALYEELDAARSREQAARERERFLERLLAEERQALKRLRGAGPLCPAVARPPSEPSPLHAQIFAVLQQHPDGCTRAEIEAAVEATQPLGGVLDGLCRRKRLIRLGKGLYALPTDHKE